MIELLQIGVLLLLLNPLIKLISDEYFELNDKLFGIGLYGGFLSVTMGNIFGGWTWAIIALVSGIIIIATCFRQMIKDEF